MIALILAGVTADPCGGPVGCDGPDSGLGILLALALGALILAFAGEATSGE